MTYDEIIEQLKDRELMDGAEFQELEPVANK